jgi:hypothetical protein
VNVCYLNDYQQKGFTNTQFYAWVQFDLEKYNQFYYNSLQTNFTLQKNNQKLFQKQSGVSRLLG